MNDKPLFPNGPEKTAEQLFNCPLSEQPPKRPTDPEDNVIKSVTKFFVVGIVIWVLYILFLLAAFVGIGYVAWHFISKLW